MSRAADAAESPETPTMTEIDVYRFCRSLLEWEGVHLVGEERVGDHIRVLLSTDESSIVLALLMTIVVFQTLCRGRR